MIHIYGNSDALNAALVKEPQEAGLKKHSVKVQKFLDELLQIGIPKPFLRIGPSILCID